MALLEAANLDIDLEGCFYEANIILILKSDRGHYKEGKL